MTYTAPLVRVSHPNGRLVIDTNFEISSARYGSFSRPLNEASPFPELGETGQKLVKAAFAEGTVKVDIAPYFISVEVGSLFSLQPIRSTLLDLLQELQPGVHIDYRDDTLSAVFTITSIGSLGAICSLFRAGLDGHPTEGIGLLEGRPFGDPEEYEVQYEVKCLEVIQEPKPSEPRQTRDALQVTISVLPGNHPLRPQKYSFIYHGSRRTQIKYRPKG